MHHRFGRLEIPCSWLLLLLAFATIALAACGGDKDDQASALTPAAATATATTYPLTVTDHSGTEVTIAARPERVLAVLPSIAQLIADLGLTDRVVGRDDFSSELPGWERLPTVGGNDFHFNIEVAAELNPDLLLVGAGGTDEFIEQARTLGYPVIALFAPTSVADLLKQFRLFGKIFDTAADAETLISALQARLDSVATRQGDDARPRVYIELDQLTPTQPFIAVPGSFANDVLELAGGVNAFADATGGFLQTNWEAIIAADPDVILLLDATGFAREAFFNPVSREEVAARAGWDTIRAVQNGQIIAIDPDLFTAGANIAATVERLAEILDAARAASAHWSETEGSALLRAA